MMCREPRPPVRGGAPGLRHARAPQDPARHRCQGQAGRRVHDRPAQHADEVQEQTGLSDQGVIPMPSLQGLRRKIGSIKNTQKITKAMKMVAAAKLKRAQERILAARPYAKKMAVVLGSLASRANRQAHPLLRKSAGNRIELLVVTSDRGLCGAFNTNILRKAVEFLRQKDRKSTRLNSSHSQISYAVFCLKKKNVKHTNHKYKPHGRINGIPSHTLHAPTD